MSIVINNSHPAPSINTQGHQSNILGITGPTGPTGPLVLLVSLVIQV